MIGQFNQGGLNLSQRSRCHEVGVVRARVRSALQCGRTASAADPPDGGVLESEPLCAVFLRGEGDAVGDAVRGQRTGRTSVRGLDREARRRSWQPPSLCTGKRPGRKKWSWTPPRRKRTSPFPPTRNSRPRSCGAARARKAARRLKTIATGRSCASWSGECPKEIPTGSGFPSHGKCWSRRNTTLTRFTPSTSRMFTACPRARSIKNTSSEPRRRWWSARMAASSWVPAVCRKTIMTGTRSNPLSNRSSV